MKRSPVMTRLRSPFEMIEGCYHLPRFIDKVRLHSAGELPPEYEKSFCHPRGLDGVFLAHFAMTKELLIEAITRIREDVGIGRWFSAYGQDFVNQRDSWVKTAPRLGLPGEKMFAELQWAKKNVYLGCDDPACDTVFKMLDWDEGRRRE